MPPSFSFLPVFNDKYEDKWFEHGMIHEDMKIFQYSFSPPSRITTINCLLRVHVYFLTSGNEPVREGHNMGGDEYLSGRTRLDEGNVSHFISVEPNDMIMKNAECTSLMPVGPNPLFQLSFRCKCDSGRLLHHCRILVALFDLNTRSSHQNNYWYFTIYRTGSLLRFSSIHLRDFSGEFRAQFPTINRQ